MDELTIVFQFIAFIVLYFIIVQSIKGFSSLIKRKRIRDFSININEFNTNDSFIFKTIFKFSNILESLVIFNNVSRTYDEYVDSESRLKNGMNYISIKILLGILFIFMYIFVIFLYRQTVDVIMLIIMFILGYIIPDFYCIFISSKYKKITNNNILNAIIVMSNSYKVGRSTEQAINDVINRSEGKVKEEFIKVLSDIKIGMSSYEAFKRMYDRTDNKTILDISNLLYGISKSGVATSQVFSEMEKKLVNKEKIENNIKRLHETNLMAFIVFTFLPLIFIIYIMFFKLDLQMILTNSIGDIIILILSLIYILYSLIIWKIAKEVK